MIRLIYQYLLSISLASAVNYDTKPRPRFMLFGDSITQFGIDPQILGFGTLLANAYSRKVDVINRGLSGYTTKKGLEMLPFIVEEWASHPPDLVTIFFGANDAVSPDPPNNVHIPLEDYVENLKLIVSQLKQGFPNVQLLLISPPPADDSQTRLRKESWFRPRLNKVVQEYAQACVETAAELELPSIDTWTLFQNEKRWQKMFKDGVHFSAAGHKFMYKILQQHIDELLPAFARDKIPTQYHTY